MITLALDVETSKIPRFRPWHPGSFLVSVGMAWEDKRVKTWTLNHKEAQGVNQRQVLAEIQSELDKAHRIVGHNLKFDLQWLRHAGLRVDRQKFYCTQVAEYLIQGQAKVSYHLADVCLRYSITPKIDRVKIFWDAGYETDEIPLSVLTPYLEQDCINSLVLYQRQVPIISKWKMQRIVALQMDLMNILSEMESAGALVDVEKANALHSSLEEKIHTLEVELKLEIGRDDLNLGSTNELSAALYGGVIKREYLESYQTTHNVTKREAYPFTYADPKKGTTVKWRNVVVQEPITKTRRAIQEIELPRIFKPIDNTELEKGGFYSTDKNTLSQLKGETDRQKKILTLLKEHSTASKAAETFRGDQDDSGILGKLMPDHRVHPSFNQTVTATGRLSSSNPNGQNWPRKGTSPVKTIFVPRFDLIGNGDLSQLEWRVAAWMSQDPVAMQEIIDNVDYHRDNAIQFFGANPKLDNDHPKFKPIRTVAKVFGFRLLYGGSAYGMYMDQTMPNFSLPKWVRIVQGYYEKYQVLQQWQQDNIELVEKQGGWLQTPSGRKLVFPRLANADRDGNVYSITAIKNYPVQSFATADITPLAMVVIKKRMRQAGCQSLLFLQVHDSIVFDLVKDEVDTVADITVNTFRDLPKLMHSFWGINFNLPLGGEFEIGPNYGELKRIR